MTEILKPKLRSINLKSVDRRISYIQTLVTSAHNDLILNNKAMDRSRLLNFITGAVKLIHDMQTDSNLEELDKRLSELEDDMEAVPACTLENPFVSAEGLEVANRAARWIAAGDQWGGMK
ncbi:MAG: hypothetical protein KAV87_48195 [Desulfobacteraceae bacterium]|nr:hypothetical protein [Desulfobacteraceae bacterium]